MRLTFQISLALLIGLGALYPGVMSFFVPETIFMTFFNIDLAILEADLRLAIESQVRLLAGMWIAAGMFLLIALLQFEKHGLLIRLVLAGMALSAVGELLAVLEITGSMQQELLPSLLTLGICVALEGWRLWLVNLKPVK